MFVFPTYVEVTSGEFLPTSLVLAKQLDPHVAVVYGPAFSDETTYYKSEMVKKLHPQVLALGNSKILTMRAPFFNDGVTFYNAGGVVGEVENFKNFLEVTEAQPSVLIITVEPLYFDPLVSISTSTLNTKYQPASYMTKVGNIIIQDWTRVYTDYFEKKFTISGLKEGRHGEETIGLNARINGSGFRNDGSYHYGKQYEDATLKEQKIARAITFIETKTSIQGKEFFSTQALSQLESFLVYCKERNIYVIGYIPPTPKAVEDTYRKYPQYDYMTHTKELTSPLFEKYGFQVYDYYSMAKLGAGDEETIDEYHTSEKVMVRVLSGIVTTDKKLQKVTSKDRLGKILANVRDHNDVMK